MATTYRVGFRDEDEQTAGMAHLVEHLMGRTARRAARSGGTGAQVVAESRRDYSIVGAVTPGGTLTGVIHAGVLRPAGLSIELDELHIEAALIEREYQDLIEARPYGLFPRFLAARHLYDTVGEGGTGYGDPQTLHRQTPAAVTAFVGRHYTLARTVLSVVGDFSPDEVIDVVAEYFAGAPAQPASRQPWPVNGPLVQDREVRYRRAGVPTAVALAWRLPDPADDLRAHVGRVLTGQAAFAPDGPVAAWLRDTYRGIGARMWWNTFNNPWESRTGLCLTVELTGGGSDRLAESAMALRQALPGLIERVSQPDLDILAARHRLDLTRKFDHPMERARLLGTMEALFDGATCWLDLWTVLCATAHDPDPLARIVEATGCLVMRCET
ncbi:insulinase family protein [Dactylosporangium sp. NPDC051485]|uniref:M16 family metallopeptidase n=1 Tax=Dactylosporangium sp. NPDC051485 TaxID=3154846 RepID=UPI0034369B30